MEKKQYVSYSRLQKKRQELLSDLSLQIFLKIEICYNMWKKMNHGM